jgi:mono/diheme cytochrome c family protein
MHRVALAVLAALVLAAAGCGGDDTGGGGGGGGGGADTGAETSSGSGSGGIDAKSTFASTCGGCHTLKAADTNGQVGPNLDEIKPDAETVKKTIKEGPSVMPANLLEGAEADAVAQFVADNAGG